MFFIMDETDLLFMEKESCVSGDSKMSHDKVHVYDEDEHILWATVTRCC